MSSSDPSTNGGPPARPNLRDMNLEPVDPSELSADAVPTVEVVRLPRRGFGFGKALLWCLLFLVMTQLIPALVLLIGMSIAAIRDGQVAQVDVDWFKSQQAQPILQLSFFVGQSITILFSLVILRWSVGRDWKRKIGLRVPELKHVMLVVVAMPALLTLSIALESVIVPHVYTLSEILGRFGIQIPSVEGIINGTSTWPWMIAVLLVGIGPAIGEELWCRGFLGQGLASRYGNLGGVLLTSFLFGLIHVEPPQAIMAFLMGIALHLCYLATRSIWVPMLMHFLNNTLVILAISETAPVPLVSTLETAFQHSPGLALSASIIVLVTVGIILHRSRVRILTPSMNELPTSLYPHVETPMHASANRPVADGMPVLEVGALIVAVGLFTAIWYGL